MHRTSPNSCYTKTGVLIEALISSQHNVGATLEVLHNVTISMTQEEMAVLLPQIEDIEMDLIRLVPDDEAMMITPVDYNLVLCEEEEMTITQVEH